MMIKRKIYNRAVELLREFRIVYISGPRQAGKSTLAKEIATTIDMKYFTLDNQSLLEVANSDPHGLLASLGKRIVLDEFQYVPTLIPAIKMVSDNLQPDEKGIFLLTGSSDIFKSAKTQEALPGHMARLELFPFSAVEVSHSKLNIVDYVLAQELAPLDGKLVDRLQMAEKLIRGGYPEASTKSTRNRSAWFKSYVMGRLYKDFATLTETRGDYIERIDALSRLLAGMSGNVIKYANIANKVAFDDKTVKKYMQALELMFITKTIRPYVKNRAKRSVLGLPKIHFIDTGLACYLLGLKNPKTLMTSNYYGGLLENFVFMEILKQSGWAEEEISIYHFRDKKNDEVDIVMERDDGKIIGVEVKASASVKQQDFKGLHELELYAGDKFVRGILVYTGAQLLPMRYKNRVYYAMPISFLLGTDITQQEKNN